MNERIDARGTDIGMALKIPVAIEQAGRRDQFDTCPKREILVKARAKAPGPPNLLHDAGGLPRESRVCGVEPSKRSRNPPAGAAADGIKFFARGCGDRFSPLGPDANGG